MLRFGEMRKLLKKRKAAGDSKASRRRFVVDLLAHGTPKVPPLPLPQSPFQLMHSQNMMSEYREHRKYRDVPGPILGLRGWRSSRHLGATNGPFESYLFAVGVGTPWDFGNAQKADYFPSASGGYWALRFSEDIPPIADIAGVVAIWGRVHVHERGWRAEYAYPVVIWPNQPDVKREPPMPGFPSAKKDLAWIERIAEKYGVECLECAPWEEAA